MVRGQTAGFDQCSEVSTGLEVKISIKIETDNQVETTTCLMLTLSDCFVFNN